MREHLAEARRTETVDSLRGGLHREQQIDPAVTDGTGHVDRVGSAVLQVLHQHPEVDALVVVVPTGG